MHCMYVVSSVMAVLMVQPQSATNEKDIHNVFSFSYLVESFALILEAKC